MGKFARNIGIWAAGLAGLALSSGCASMPKQQFSAGVSLKPTYYKFDIAEKIPPSKAEIIPVSDDPVEVRISGGYDLIGALSVKDRIQASETVNVVCSLDFGVSGQRIYSGGKEPGTEGSIYGEESDPRDTRQYPSKAYVLVTPSAWTLTPGLGLEFILSENTALSAGVKAPYNYKWKIEEGNIVNKGLMNEDPVVYKIRTTSSSGFGLGASLGLNFKTGENSTFYISAEGDKFNLGKGHGTVLTGQLGLGYEWRF